jgi:transposase
MGKHRSNDLKQAVVDFYNRMKKKSIEKTAQTFQIPDETVRRWIERYEAEGDVKYKYRGCLFERATL